MVVNGKWWVFYWVVLVSDVEMLSLFCCCCFVLVLLDLLVLLVLLVLFSFFCSSLPQSSVDG